MLDKLLFHSKAWQLFLVFFPAAILLDLFFTRSIAAFIIYCIWLPLLGVRLRKFLPAYYQFHYILFLISWALLSLVLISSFFITPGLFSTTTNIIYAVVVVTSFFTMMGFIARAIKSLQTHDRATVNDYFGDVFWLFIFPIGVWIIQPRLNLLGDQFYR